MENISLRKLILQASYDAGACHIGSALSCVDIVDDIYSKMKKEDRFIFSKASGVCALYAVLAKRGIIAENKVADYLKKYPPEQLCELITIWIVLRIGEWNGYSIPCLQKDFNKLLVIWQKFGMNHFTPQEYEKYRQNVQKVNKEYNKHIEVPPYEEWRKENFRRKFEEVNIS